jgi:ketosteroid isomerase-like protein
MKNKTVLIILCAGSVALAGCQKQVRADDAIRDGIRQHLASLKTINLSAMDMNVTSVAITGDTALAQVEYLPKTGAPAGAGMRVSYALEKHDQQWVVVKANAAGGAIEHPDPGKNPHLQTSEGPTHGTLPNFRELVQPSTQNTPSDLPPGHPVVPAYPSKPN